MDQQRVSLERLLKRIRTRDAKTLAELEDFVEFLFQKKGRPGRRFPIADGGVYCFLKDQGRM